MFRLILPTLFLISSTLPQDISFPSSVQDNPDHDSEFLQVQNGTPEGSLLNQPMTELHPGGGGPGAALAGGYGDLGIVPGGVIDLGLAVHRVARNQGTQQWWTYSPTSIATALYMVLLGANGKTYTELARLLGVNSISSSLKPHEDFSSTLRNLQITGHEKNVIRLANGLFIQNDYSVRQDYRDVITSLYQSTIQPLDFRFNGAQARDVINSWVAEKTQGKIQEMLSEMPSPDTKIVLASTLYFKGEWASPFPNELTKLHNFYPNGRSQPTKTKVPMMATMGTYRYYHDRTLNCEVVGIPYKGDNIIFYLVLPHNSNKEKLKTLENQISHSEIDRMVENTVLTSDVIVAIPKMKLTSEYTLNTILQELGVRALFDPKEADLSLLSSAANIPRQPPGPFEEEEKFIFPRMKKLNASMEERKKRQVKQLLPSTRNDNSLEPSRHLRTLGNPGLYVNRIIHKVIVDINEKGTEAAATTAVSMSKTVSHTVKADAPFLFFIRHEATKMILFWGSVVTPPV